jgi:HAD superfamily hydrolase (TIGR01509 family)
MNLSLRPRAIFIDLDGTLADSLWVMRAAYQAFLERHRVTSTIAEFDSLNGPPLSEVVRSLKAAHSLTGDESELLATYMDLIDQSYVSVSPCPGADDLLWKAKDNGCVVGVVTSNSSERANRWLKRACLSHLIDFVVAGEEVRYGKPNPEPYLRASERVSCSAAETIAVEDSLQGALSAVGAGLRTFIVTNELNFDTWPKGIIAVGSLRQLADQLW